jgi:hypothetical protein
VEKGGETEREKECNVQEGEGEREYILFHLPSSIYPSIHLSIDPGERGERGRGEGQVFKMKK